MMIVKLFKIICVIALCVCGACLTSRSDCLDTAVLDVAAHSYETLPSTTTSTASPMAVNDSVTVTATALPEGSRQEFTWALTLNEDKMTSWLVRRVKEKLEEGKEYISLTTTSNTATVTALEYFKYGIKYTTYWILTATSVDNPELSASCDIQL